MNPHETRRTLRGLWLSLPGVLVAWALVAIALVAVSLW